MMKTYKLKYCCDDVCVFPSKTLLDYDNALYNNNNNYGLTAVSTYQLKTYESNGQKKKGKVYLYKLQKIENEKKDSLERNYNLEYKRNINYHSGVLQSNFLFSENKLLLGSVCVNGFYLSDPFEENSKDLVLETPGQKDANKDINNSGLSFDAFENKTDRIIVTFSNGYICDVVNGKEQNCWKAHDYHVWSVTFNGEEHVITTSSDDCTFAVWDLRTNKYSLKNNKTHTEGITVVKFEKMKNLIYTASYDGKIRLFDYRNINTPLQIVNVDSSIWRLKFLYKNGEVSKLLVAACDGGAKIFKKEKEDFVLIKEVENNKELTYGIDVIEYIHKEKNKKENETKNENIYLTCSFYNKEVQLWT